MARRGDGPLFPFEPAARLVAVNSDRSLHPLGMVGLCPHCHDCVNGAYLRQTFNVGERKLRQWINDGVDEFDADRIATTLGQHPDALWPDYTTSCVRHAGSEAELVDA